MSDAARPHTRIILALNCGSSSLKFGLYSVTGADVRTLRTGEAEEIGRDHTRFSFADPEQKTPLADKEKVPLRDHAEALQHALKMLKETGAPEPDAVGHRVVHGGQRVRTHRVITEETIRDLQASQNFAPLHLPLALRTLQVMREHSPQTPQVACMDTAFHVNLPDVTRTLPLPEKVRALGIERFGFHG